MNFIQKTLFCDKANTHYWCFILITGIFPSMQCCIPTPKANLKSPVVSLSPPSKESKSHSKSKWAKAKSYCHQRFDPHFKSRGKKKQQLVPRFPPSHCTHFLVLCVLPVGNWHSCCCCHLEDWSVNKRYNLQIGFKHAVQHNTKLFQSTKTKNKKYS